MLRVAALLGLQMGSHQQAATIAQQRPGCSLDGRRLEEALRHHVPLYERMVWRQRLWHVGTCDRRVLCWPRPRRLLMLLLLTWRPG